MIGIPSWINDDKCDAWNILEYMLERYLQILSPIKIPMLHSSNRALPRLKIRDPQMEMLMGNHVSDMNIE